MHGSLNERQLAVLEWVGMQCPDGFWPDSTCKASARACRAAGWSKSPNAVGTGAPNSPTWGERI
ncbi:hypothetical protein K388_02673 [Streptomyces sp. KhCrAH-43]|nr:hypothetical protein K388_02673 [Streptomyces sp. KhCrAH-43]